MKKARPESTETIAIQGFVDLDEIDPIFFDSPYYLVPANKSDRIYILLREALQKTNKVGIASFVLRTREYLAIIRPYGEALLLNTMHFADEVRGAEDMPSPVEIPAKELEMAVQLVEAMGEEFDPSQYKNDYNEALQSVIERKLAGKKVETKAAPKEPTKVTDLMARLKASLESSATPAKKPARTAAAKKAAAPAKTKAAAPKNATTKKPKLKLVA